MNIKQPNLQCMCKHSRSSEIVYILCVERFPWQQRLVCVTTERCVELHSVIKGTVCRYSGWGLPHTRGFFWIASPCQWHLVCSIVGNLFSVFMWAALTKSWNCSVLLQGENQEKKHTLKWRHSLRRQQFLGIFRSAIYVHSLIDQLL